MTDFAADTPFVSTQWLAAHLNDPHVAVVDASWYLPNAGRDARGEFLDGHIPGAVFFDLDAIADTESGLPHMLPTAEAFGAAVGALGLAADQTIVVYDGAGLFSAPRVRWTFMVMGANDVRLLDGGLPQWRAEGRPLESGEPSPAPAAFEALLDTTAVADLLQMRAIVDEGGRQIVDARPARRFTGEAPEPRAGMLSGHMPGAKSAPADQLVENGTLKDADTLRAQFAAAGVDLDQPLVTSCGSGVTAAVLKLALERAGATDVMLYDGSWAEWGSRDDTPVVTG